MIEPAMSATTTTRSKASPGASMTLILASAAGLAVANIYYNQPMLELMERELPGPLMGVVPTATQLGYALGLFLLVPLGDRLERRALIVAQFILLALALTAAAMAPNPLVLVVASLLVGLFATVAQQIVPLAAHLATPEKRGATVGAVMAGLLTGILLSRTLAGIVAANAGWRDMFAIAVPLAVVAAIVLAISLPRSKAESAPPYFQLLRSTLTLWNEFHALRVAALTQAALFAAFTILWTMLAFRLAEPEFNLGPEVAGLFGLVGVVGITAAPIAGRFADRHGPNKIVVVGAIATLVSWLVFGLWGSLIGLGVGVILLDFGVQSALIANQTLVFSLRPEAQARLTTVLMGSMFLGGAFGSAAASWAWSSGGWAAVSLLGLLFAAIAVILQLLNARKR